MDIEGPARETQQHISEYARASIRVLDAKHALTARRSEILASIDPKELGSNEAQREANLYQRCKSLHDALHDAERAKLYADGCKQCAIIAWESIQLLTAQEAINGDN